MRKGCGGAKTHTLNTLIHFHSMYDVGHLSGYLCYEFSHFYICKLQCTTFRVTSFLVYLDVFQLEKQKRLERIRQKRAQLEELILQVCGTPVCILTTDHKVHIHQFSKHFYSKIHCIPGDLTHDICVANAIIYQECFVRFFCFTTVNPPQLPFR